MRRDRSKISSSRSTTYPGVQIWSQVNRLTSIPTRWAPWSRARSRSKSAIRACQRGRHPRRSGAARETTRRRSALPPAAMVRVPGERTAAAVGPRAGDRASPRARWWERPVSRRARPAPGRAPPRPASGRARAVVHAIAERVDGDRTGEYRPVDGSAEHVRARDRGEVDQRLADRGHADPVDSGGRQWVPVSNRRQSRPSGEPVGRDLDASESVAGQIVQHRGARARDRGSRNRELSGLHLA